MTKKQYLKPKALNLSGLTVIGYNEIGIGGSNPLGSCANGTSPTGALCEGGSTVTQMGGCSPTGISPTVGACSPSGGVVTSDCTSGTTIYYPT